MLWRGYSSGNTSHVTCCVRGSSVQSCARRNPGQHSLLLFSRTLEACQARECSHYYTGFSGRTSRACASRQGRQRTAHVARSIFDPPPFNPRKLTVNFLPATTPTVPAPPCPRRYTLTHNDITGDLNLSIGPHFNIPQISNIYTRLLRDEVTAEWKHDTSPSLHIYCHVSGEERWLAPPILRDYIFRREIPLVLSTFLYADKPLLDAYPHLQDALVVVHFQSHLRDLDCVENWGILGNMLTWQQIPPSILRRVWLAMLGVPVDLTLRPKARITAAVAQQVTQALTETPQPSKAVAAIMYLEQEPRELETSGSQLQQAGDGAAEAAVLVVAACATPATPAYQQLDGLSNAASMRSLGCLPESTMREECSSIPAALNGSHSSVKPDTKGNSVPAQGSNIRYLKGQRADHRDRLGLLENSSSAAAGQSRLQPDLVGEARVHAARLGAIPGSVDAVDVVNCIPSTHDVGIAPFNGLNEQTWQVRAVPVAAAYGAQSR